MSVKIFKEIEFFRGQLDFMQGQNASEFVGSAVAFAKGVKVKELLVNAQILDFDFFLDAQ